MAILFSQADGSDQHYDTYEEFEQAFILLKRLNGEKVPQDLLDEVKAKNSRSEPVQIEINGQVFEDLISSAAEPLGKDANGGDLYEGDYVTGLEDNRYSNTDDTVVMEVVGAAESYFSNDENIEVKIVGDWTRYSVISSEFIKLSDNLDEAKAKFAEINGDKEPKFEVGDKVRIISNKDGTDTPFHGFRIGSIVTITGVLSGDRLDATNGVFSQILCREHYEKIGDAEDYPTEFRDGDLVRVTESFGDSFGDVAGIHSVLTVRIDGTGRVLGVGKVLIGDNHDKIQLVCRKEDRKDIEL